MNRIKALLMAPFFYLLVQSKRAAKFKNGLKKPHRWYRRQLEGCVSSDGTPFYVYYKKGSVNKLVVYFSGGGASWNGYTTARPTTLKAMLAGEKTFYFPAVPPYLDLLFGGILGEKPNGQNPFAEWNFIYIPYATGDFHIGNNDFAYTGPDGEARVLHHHGARNVAAALADMPKEFAGPQQLFIAGESAGAFGCMAHAAAVAGRFPACENVTVYADGAQIEVPGDFWQRTIREVWKADEDFYSGLGGDGQLIVDWIERAARQMGEGVALLHSNSRYDETLAAFRNQIVHDDFSLGGAALAEYHAGLAAATGRLAATLPNYHYFICNQDYNEEAGTTSHTTSRWDKRYYEEKVEDTTMAQWLGAAVNKKRYQSIGGELLGP